MNSAFLRDGGARKIRIYLSERGNVSANSHHTSDLVVVPTPFTHERVDLVNEDDGGLQLASQREQSGDQLV